MIGVLFTMLDGMFCDAGSLGLRVELCLCCVWSGAGAVHRLYAGQRRREAAASVSG